MSRQLKFTATDSVPHYRSAQGHFSEACPVIGVDDKLAEYLLKTFPDNFDVTKRSRKEAPAENKIMSAPPENKAHTQLYDVPGIDKKTATTLDEAGVHTAADVGEYDLVTVEGIGAKTAKKVERAVEAFLEG